MTAVVFSAYKSEKRPRRAVIEHLVKYRNMEEKPN